MKNEDVLMASAESMTDILNDIGDDHAVSVVLKMLEVASAQLMDNGEHEMLIADLNDALSKSGLRFENEGCEELVNALARTFYCFVLGDETSSSGKLLVCLNMLVHHTKALLSESEQGAFNAELKEALQKTNLIFNVEDDGMNG